LRFSHKILFNFIGHSQDIIFEEVKYFKVLCFGSFSYLAVTSLSGFYNGRGKTKVVLFVNLAGMVINILFDYLLIFGNFGFPKMSIEGAAVATTIGFIVNII
jgi:MATE family multidrug resistance protein